MLVVGSGPPLVDGFVVLIEFADPRPAEPTVSPQLALRGWHQIRQVGFDVGLDTGSGALEATESFHFIRHELIVGRFLQGQKDFQEGFDHGGPWATMGTAAWLGTIAGLVAQERCAQLVEPRAAYPKVAGGSDGIEVPGIEVAEDTTDEFGWQTMGKLLLFTPLTCLASLVPRQSFRAASLEALPPNLRSFPHVAKGLDGNGIWSACRYRAHTRSGGTSPFGEAHRSGCSPAEPYPAGGA